MYKKKCEECGTVFDSKGPNGKLCKGCKSAGKATSAKKSARPPVRKAKRAVGKASAATGRGNGSPAIAGHEDGTPEVCGNCMHEQVCWLALIVLDNGHNIVTGQQLRPMCSKYRS